MSPPSLDPRTRALLDRARAGFEPSRADEARVEAGLLAAIGATTLGAAMAGASAAVGKAAGLAGSAFAKLALSCVIVVSVAVGGAAVLTGSLGPAAQERTPATTRGVVSAAAPAARATEPATEAVVEPVETAARVPVLSAPPAAVAAPAKSSSTARTTATPLPTATATATATSSATSNIAEEVAFVREGTSRLHASDPVGALSAFDAHASAFPHGVLEEERSAGRVLALCALGRTSDARARAEELRAAHPASAHASRIRKSCVGFW
jgi:hypothetical protein